MGNTVSVCNECGKLDYSEVPIERFVGKYVQKAFETGPGRFERMWVEVKACSPIELVGELNNVPEYCVWLKEEDTVTVTPEQVMKVMIQDPDGDPVLVLPSSLAGTRRTEEEIETATAIQKAFGYGFV